jgi:hypothetical protein
MINYKTPSLAAQIRKEAQKNLTDMFKYPYAERIERVRDISRMNNTSEKKRMLENFICQELYLQKDDALKNRGPLLIAQDELEKINARPMEVQLEDYNAYIA